MNKIAKFFSAAIATAALTGAAGAGQIDLTQTGASGILNGGLFMQGSVQPSGTGVFDPIVRFQASGDAQGYNTDNRPVQFDEKTDIHTHSITLDAVGLVTLSGVEYRQFALDINEPHGSSRNPLVLDQMQVFLSDAKANTYPNLGTKVYDLGAGNSVLLDATLSHGSGSSDMFAYIPESDFAGHGGSQFLYLYSHFSNGQGGFEEWAAGSACPAPSPAPIPEPSTAVLAVAGLGSLCLRRAARKSK